MQLILGAGMPGQLARLERGVRRRGKDSIEPGLPVLMAGRRESGARELL